MASTSSTPAGCSAMATVVAFLAPRMPRAVARRRSSAVGCSGSATATTSDALAASPAGNVTVCPFSPVKPSRSSVAARSPLSSSPRIPRIRASARAVVGLAVLRVTESMSATLGSAVERARPCSRLAAMDLLHSPLHDRHVALGAKLAEFGGWDMPLEYAGGGVLAEHKAVREAVGLFDVSHLGKALVRGTGAADFVNQCLTNDLGRIETGKAQYTLCCDEDGGTVDDLIAYLRSDFEVFLIPNAA